MFPSLQVKKRWGCSLNSLISFLRSISSLTISPERVPPYQHLFLFIPQAEEQRPKAMLKRQRLNLKNRILIVALFQLIVGNPWAEVMDMMKTDIPGEPLQDFGELIERTAIQAGVEELPIWVAFPISWVKVMLNIE